MDLKLTELKNTMIAQTHKNSVVANNLANVNTTGFKRDVMFFEVLKKNETPEVQMKVETDFSQGPLRQTNNPLDLAISGRGFFTIDTGDGEAYTREGHFTVDEGGILKTSDGNPVLGRGGWINLSIDGIKVGEVTINTRGEIFMGDELIDTLKITDFDSYSDLKKAGGNLFVAGENVIPRELEDPVILQGKLEGSNVNPVREMIDLIEIQRQFESSQRAVRTIDSALRKAANDISRYR